MRKEIELIESWGKDTLDCVDRPSDWPANPRENAIENLFIAINRFKDEPNYKNKEILISLADYYDLNQKSMLGEFKNREYEVALINYIFLHAEAMNCKMVKVFLYDHIGCIVRKFKSMSHLGIDIDASMDSFKKLEGSLYLYYLCYRCFIFDMDMCLSEKIIQAMNIIISKQQNEIEVYRWISAFVIMLNDISYFECKKRNEIWAFSRDEIKELIRFEVKLLRRSGEKAIEKPLKGVLMTTISNYILKSRFNFNSDYVVKYMPKDDVYQTVVNNEVWLNEIENLNDEKEMKVIPELLKDKFWLSYDWASEIDFSTSRNYHVSSFCKNINDANMYSDYGECEYGFKNDRLVELLAPIHLIDYGDEKQYPILSQVIPFDVLYDNEEAKQEINYLCDLINEYDMTDSEKHDFFEEIMQYWILSVKEPEWSNERERRYVIFTYDGYNYIEVDKNDENFLKIKTSIFFGPDFILGTNPVRVFIEKYLNSKRSKIFNKDYIFCPVCLSADFDSVFDSNKKCKICGNTGVEKVIIDKRIRKTLKY